MNLFCWFMVCLQLSWRLSSCDMTGNEHFMVFALIRLNSFYKFMEKFLKLEYWIEPGFINIAVFFQNDTIQSPFSTGHMSKCLHKWGSSHNITYHTRTNVDGKPTKTLHLTVECWTNLYGNLFNKRIYVEMTVLSGECSSYWYCLTKRLVAAS